MKVLKIVYKAAVGFSAIVSVILSLNLFGVEFFNPYMFVNYEYAVSYQNIRYYEEVLPIKGGYAAVIFRGKIGVITSSTIKWTKIAYQNHKCYSDGQVAVAYVQGGKYLHIITPYEQKDIMYPIKIRDVRAKDGKVCVLLSQGKESYIIGYDPYQNIQFSAKLNEYVVDFDIADSFAVVLVRGSSGKETALLHIDRRGIYMTKTLTAEFSGVKNLFVIRNYILVWDGKRISVYDTQLQKRERTFELSVAPYRAVGNPEVLLTGKEILAYNEYTNRFYLKHLPGSDFVSAAKDKIAAVRGNEVEIFSINLNRLKVLKVQTLGFEKAVLSQDRLYYVYSDRIECYRERW